MTPEGKKIRSNWLTVRLNPDETEQLNKYFKDSTCRQLSDYVRKIILNKPVNIKYRNASLDDFLKEVLLFKKELNAIGNNFNQVVHKLHTLEKFADFEQWAISNERDKIRLFDKINSILNRLNEIHSLWSRS